MNAQRIPALVLVLSSACSPRDQPAPAVTVAVAPAADTACARAAAGRRAIPALRAEGRLDRARRTLERAQALCPSEAILAHADLLGLYADLGARPEGLALAGEVERRPDTTPAAKEAAAALRRGFAGPAPSGDDLLERGLRAWREGQHPEGQRLLDRGRIALEAAAGAPMAITVEGELAGVVGSLSWSDDGKALAVAHGRWVTVLPVDPARPPLRFTGHTAPVAALAWLHDGARLASVSADGTALVWNATTGAVERRLAVGRDPRGLSISAGDRHLAATGTAAAPSTGSPAERLLVFQLADGARVLDVEAAGAGNTGFVAGKDEVWARLSSAVQWWDLATGKQVHEVGTGDSGATVSTSGRDVAISGNQHELVLKRDYGKRARPPLTTAPGCDAHIFPSFFTPDDRTLVIERMDHQAMAFALPGGAPRWVRKGVPELHTISPDAALLAEAAPAGRVTVRDARSGAARAELEGSSALRGLAFSPGGQHLAGVVGNGGVLLWDVARPAPVRSLGAERDEIRALQAGERRLTVLRQGVLYSLDLASPGQLWSTPVSAERGLISRDAASVIAVGPQAVLWDVLGQRQRGALPAEGIHQMLPSATEVSFHAASGNAFVIRAPQGAPDRAIPALWHRSAFSADGRVVIAVTEGDGGIGVFDVATGALQCKPGAPIEKGAPWPEKIATTRDGSRFVAFVKDEVRVYQGCDPTPRVVRTGWTGAPAGDLGLTDDGRHVVYRQDIAAKLTIWPVEGGPVTELSLPESSRLTLGPASEIVAWGPNAVAFAVPGRDLFTLPITGARAASWSRVGGRLLLGFEDGTIQVIDPRKRESVAELRPLGAGPATLAVASGLYEVLGDGGGALRCALAGRVYPIDACRERLEVRGLAERVLRGEASDLEP